MPAKSPFGRLIALPLRHKLIAAGIEVAFIAGGLMWARHLPPQEYTSSVLLFFDPTAAVGLEPGTVPIDQRHALELAGSVLSDDAVSALCKHFGLFPDSRGGEAARFRSRLVLSRESTSSVRVTWRGEDRSQTMGVVNTVAVLLTSWRPQYGARQLSGPVLPEPAMPTTSTAPKASNERTPPIAKVQEKRRDATARLEALLNDQKKLRFELATIDQRIAALGEEAHRLEVSIRQANSERQANIAARQPLILQLEAQKKALDVLRVRYTDAYPDVEAAQERIAETEKKLASMPAIRPAPDAEQSHLNSVNNEVNGVGGTRSHLLEELSKEAKSETNIREEIAASKGTSKPERASGEPLSTQSPPMLSDPGPPPAVSAPNSPMVGSMDGDQLRPFKVLERATDAQAVNNPRHLLKWLIAVVGPICGIVYLLLAVWWFRAICNVETLEAIMPANIAYLGAIPGMNLWRPKV